MRNSRVSFLVYLLCCFWFIVNPVQATFNKNLLVKWQVNNPLSTATISHQEWQELLTTRVITNKEGINLVDYPNLTAVEEKKLNQYIERLSKINIRDYNRNEQLAFWINLYNALIVQLVIQYYPIDTVHEINISPGIFNAGPWGANLLTIDGDHLSLDMIQNSILRAIWNDPRIHYALNDGSIGAANLSKQAYQGAIVDEQLNAAARNYINSLRGVQVIDDKLIVSKIYRWYLADFGESEVDIIYHLSQFADRTLSAHLKHIKNINSYIYNWHLNSTVEATS